MQNLDTEARLLFKRGRKQQAAFAYARNVVISATSSAPKPAEASPSEVGSRAIAETESDADEGDENQSQFKIIRGHISDESDLNALKDERRISNLLIKRSARHDPQQRGREQAANTQERSLARKSPDVRSHERELERDGRIESDLSLSRYRSQTRKSMARRRSEGGQEGVRNTDNGYFQQRRASARQIRH